MQFCEMLVLRIQTLFAPPVTTLCPEFVITRRPASLRSTVRPVIEYSLNENATEKDVFINESIFPVQHFLFKTILNLAVDYIQSVVLTLIAPTIFFGVFLPALRLVENAKEDIRVTKCNKISITTDSVELKPLQYTKDMFTTY